MTNALLCTWTVVTDSTGRTHMEARWDAPPIAGTVAAADAA